MAKSREQITRGTRQTADRTYQSLYAGRESLLEKTGRGYLSRAVPGTPAGVRIALLQSWMQHPGYRPQLGVLSQALDCTICLLVARDSIR